MTPARWTSEELREKFVCCMYEEEPLELLEGLGLSEPHRYRAAIVYDQDPDQLPDEIVDRALERYAEFPRWCVFSFVGIEDGPDSTLEAMSWDFVESLTAARWRAAQVAGKQPHIVPLRNVPDLLPARAEVEIRGRDYLEPWTMSSRFVRRHLLEP